MKWEVAKRGTDRVYLMGDYEVRRSYLDHGLWGVWRDTESGREIVAGRLYGRPLHMQPKHAPFKYLKDAKKLVVSLVIEEDNRG